MSSRGRARTRKEPATRGTGARSIDKEPVDWRIVVPFAVLIVAIVLLFTYQEAKPFNSQDLQIHLESVDTDIAEAIFVAQHKQQATGIYFLSHLQDLSNGIQDATDTVQQKPYDPQIAAGRAKYIEVAKDVSDAIHEMALLYDNPTELAKSVSDLGDAKKTVEQLLQQQQ